MVVIQCERENSIKNAIAYRSVSNTMNIEHVRAFSVLITSVLLDASMDFSHTFDVDFMMNVLNYYFQAYARQLSNIRFKQTPTKQDKDDGSYLAYYHEVFFLQ